MISAAPWKIGSTKNELPSCCRPAMPTASTSTAMMVPQALTRPGLHGGRAEQRADEGGQQELRPDRALRDLQPRGEEHAGEADDQPAADEGAHDQPPRRHAGQLGRAAVGADGVEPAADRHVLERTPRRGSRPPRPCRSAAECRGACASLRPRRPAARCRRAGCRWCTSCRRRRGWCRRRGWR